MDEEELRRVVREAAAAAAQEAMERAARDQPTRWEALLAALTSLVTTLIDAFTGRLRDAVDHARRSGEDLAARLMLALSRTMRHLGRAIALTFLAALFVTVGVIVLTVGLIALLNEALGEPYGTLLVALLFLLAAAVAAMGARRRMEAVADAAQSISPRVR